MPAEFNFLMPVLVGAAIVFVVGLLGNVLSFSNRFVNALVTAILFAVIFGACVHLGVVQATLTEQPVPAPAG